MMPETAPDIAAPETRDENALDLGYTVSVEAFSGPLDLLLFLVRKTELDIVDIPVAAIADQFVSLVSEWQREGTLDLEAAGDFILMAATLLEIKARTIAPPPVEEGERPAEDEDDILDPRTDLIGKLLAYRKFKEAVGLLVEREAERALHVTRQLREDIPEDPDEAAGIDLGELQVAELSKYWYTLLARIGGGGPRTVMKDDLPIEGSIRRLTERAEAEREVTLYQLFAAEPALQGRISMLMATLECTRQRIVQATQHEQYADTQLRFRPVEERAIVPVVFPPEEGGKKRRRRPPLVTFQAPVAPSSDELEDAPEPEEKHETDEERFLRELNEACDLDGVLGRVHDVEKGFQQYWETLHPPEPKPVVEPPAAIVAEPVVVPEARVESPVPPVEPPSPVVEPAPVAEAPTVVAEQPAVAVSETVVVEAAVVEPVAEVPVVAEAVREEVAVPAEPAVAGTLEPVVAELVPADAAVPAVNEPVAPESIATDTVPTPLAEFQDPVVEPAAETVPANEPVAEPAVAVAGVSELPAEPVVAELVAAASVDEVTVAAVEPEANRAPIDPEPIAETGPVVESTAAVTPKDPPVAESAPVQAEPEPTALVAQEAATEAAGASVETVAVPPVEDTPPEPPAALHRDLVPEVRVEIVQEESDAELEASASILEEVSSAPAAMTAPLAVDSDSLAAPIAADEEPVEAVGLPSDVPSEAITASADPLVEAPVSEAPVAEPDADAASAPAAIVEAIPAPVAVAPPLVDKIPDPPLVEAVAAPVIESSTSAITATPQCETRPTPAPERRPRWSRTLLLLAAGSASAALAGWWALRTSPEPLATAPAGPVAVVPAPIAVLPDPQPVPSAPQLAPASAAQLDGVRRAPSVELLALVEGPAAQWLDRIELPIAVPWYACAPVADTPSSLFAFVERPVLTGLPLLAFAREGAWAWCATGAWVPPRLRVLPAAAFVPVVEPPTDLAVWAAAPDLRGIPAEVFLQPTGWAVCAGRPAVAIALQPPVRLAESAPVSATAPALAEPAAVDVPDTSAPAEAGMPFEPEPAGDIPPAATEAP